MVITESELNEIFDRLEKALDDTEHWVNANAVRGNAQ